MPYSMKGMLSGRIPFFAAMFVLASVSGYVGGASADDAKSKSIDLLVISDRSASELESWDLGDVFDYEMELANGALAMAGSDVVLKLADWDSDETFDASNLSAGEALAAALEKPAYAAMRTSSKADVVVVLIGDRSYSNLRRTHSDCGAATTANPGSANAADSAFVVVSVANACKPNSGLVHQIGHILGLRHSRFDLKSAGKVAIASNPKAYAFGYTNMKGRIADVMALDTQCNVAKVKCRHVPYYSDPELIIDGKFRLGRPILSGHGADAARVVRKNAPLVAAYR